MLLSQASTFFFASEMPGPLLIPIHVPKSEIIVAIELSDADFDTIAMDALISSKFSLSAPVTLPVVAN
jgi:hypothetical protein